MKTNKLFSMLRVMVLAVCLGATSMLYAKTTANSAEPIITLHTSIYEQAGSNNQISLVIGAVENMYLDVDCGFGPVEYELNANPLDTTMGTLIYCTVDSNATVRIYGNKPEAISYINAEGCYLTAADFTKLTNLDILSLNHNELTDIDLSQNTKLRALYLGDNPFTEATPLVIGDKPLLQLLEIPMVGYLDPNFDLTKYPEMRSFDAYYTRTLTKIDPTKCPELLQLTLEMTDVASVDVTKNPHLRILNVSETKVTELDLSQNKELLELYCTHVSGFVNKGAYKLKTLDVSNSRWLYRLNCAGNALTTLNIYHPTPTDSAGLVSLDASDNYLTHIDLSNQNFLNYVHIQNNCMDFVTLPRDSGVWQDYQYSQRALPMEPAYKEGDTIDLSKRVLRHGFLTNAIMYAIPMNTTDSFVLLDTSYYSFNDTTGIVVLKKAYQDSVVIEYMNDAFPSADMFTEPFMVKTAEDYGKPSQVMYFDTYESPVSFSVGLHGASEENPITFWVDLGTQTLTPFVATSEETPAVPNVTGAKGNGRVYIYVPDGTNVSALSIKDTYITTIDLSQLNTLRELTLTGTSLYSSTIDLKYNRQLEVLNLSHNDLTTLNLEGESDYFNKNLLHTIDVSYNRLNNTGYNADNFKLSPLMALLHFNAAHNELGDIDFSDADNLQTLDVSYNKMERLDLQHCTVLDTVRASNNSLSEIVLPEEDNIRYMDIASNKFTLANLPRHTAKRTEAGYLYAPQADIQIATKGPCTDLSTELVTINGQNTVLTWLKEDGTVLVKGTDYTLVNGFTRFLREDLDTVHCEISHPTYPAFTGANVLKTTKMLVAGMPTNKIASFVTAKDAEEVALSLAACKEGTSLYFDWEGNDNVVQYLLGSSYRLFSATTHAGATVNVYTYEPTDTITVFSMIGATLTSFDGSKLLAGTLTLQNAGLASPKLPENKQLLYELNLTGNKLTAFNPAIYPNLVMLNLSGNALKSIDVSGNARLQVLAANKNAITDVTLRNSILWFVDLSENQLQSIDLSNAPSLNQLSLAYNQLSTLDLSNQKELRGLSVVANQFRFSTLPPVLPQYGVYNYGNQAQVEVPLQDEKLIDLSSEAMVGDSATTYTWYLGEPVYNYDTFEWEGETLIEGKEYTVTNGVTTFLKPFKDVICRMSNPMFPNLDLFTVYYDVNQPMGVENVSTETEPARKYLRNGMIYIDRNGKTYTVMGQTIQ
ncbi:MAG: hypothetical protein SOT07_03840 [Paludibacteraceae bacterium]|nr:hypothetical protein [Paludibacteraceae bacterium]